MFMKALVVPEVFKKIIIFFALYRGEHYPKLGRILLDKLIVNVCFTLTEVG